jgi:hypothetical protein
MSKQITITNLTGAEPYSISLCDNTFTNCIYIGLIYNADIPYSFLVPTSYLPLTQVGVKAIDVNGCVIQDTVYLV